MVTLRRKGKAHRNPRAAQQATEEPPCCGLSPARHADSRRSVYLGKAGSDKAAEARRRHHGRERALGAETASAKNCGASFRNAIGAHDHRNVRPAENRGADTVRVLGGELAPPENGNRLPDATLAGVPPEGDATHSEE